MKKKLFLICLTVIALACVFTLIVSAEETDTVDYDRTYTLDGVAYNLWEMDSAGVYHPLTWYLNSDGEMRSAWTDGQTNKNGTYITLGCCEGQLSKMTVNESDGKTYTSDLSFVIVNLNGVKLTYENKEYELKYIHYKAFHTDTVTQTDIGKNYTENSILKVVFLPETLNHIGYHDRSHVIADYTAFYSFNNCTALEYVEFHKNTVFDDNIINRGSFTDCSSLKAISMPDSVLKIGASVFKNCSSMQAVYLSSALQSINITDKNISFEGCTDMYYVSEPFTMNSANDIPSKPSLYCFPSNLTTIPPFYANSNETVVIGTGVTSHSTGVYAGSGVKTAVYLGNMTSFGLVKSQSTTLNVLFANAVSEPTISVFNGGTFSGSAVYLCKLNKYQVLGEGEWKEGTTHFENPSKTTITPSVSCTEPSMKATFCFCGCKIADEEVEGTVSSHDYDYLNNDKAVLVGIVYSAYSQKGEKTVMCGNCGEKVVIEAPALFVCLGYSTPENGSDGIAIGYTVNSEAITEYEDFTDKTVRYGVFAILADKLGDNDIFDENGTATQGAITADISDYQFSSFQLKIVGFETEEQKEVKLAMGAYVAVTDDENKTIYSYMQSDKKGEQSGNYYVVSYYDIIPKTDNNGEVQL